MVLVSIGVEDSHLLGSKTALFSIMKTPKYSPFFDRGGCTIWGGGRGGGGGTIVALFSTAGG